MKSVLLLFFLLQGSVVFGQVKFKNEKLALLYEIYHKTTKGNINSFMKSKEFELGEADDKPEGKIKELRSFSTPNNDVLVRYIQGDKVFDISCIYNGALNNVFIEMELAHQGYTAKEVKVAMNGMEINKKIWSKAGSIPKFVTFAAESEKMGLVGYGIYNE